MTYEDTDARRRTGSWPNLPGYHGLAVGRRGRRLPRCRPGHRSARSFWCPGPTALLAPQWVPWEQRVQPGDLEPGRPAGAHRRRPAAGARVPAHGRPRNRRRRRRRSASAAVRCSAHAAAARPRNAGTTAITAAIGDGAVDQAGLPRLRVLAAAGGFARHDVRGVRQRVVRRRARRRLRPTAAERIPTPRPAAGAARRSTSRTTTACSISWNRASPRTFRPPTSDGRSAVFMPSISSRSKLGTPPNSLLTVRSGQASDAVLGVAATRSNVGAGCGRLQFVTPDRVVAC